MFVRHVRSGYLGMVMHLRGGVAAMQAVNSGPWTRARITMLRPATRAEVRVAGVRTRGGTPLGHESLAIVDYLELVNKLHGAA
jgi:hypothetical protein